MHERVLASNVQMKQWQFASSKRQLWPIAGDKDNQISQSLRDTEMDWIVAYRRKT